MHLQTPFERTSVGFDKRDQALDIVVDVERTWSWKDERHVDVLTRSGYFGSAEVKEVWREAKAVVKRIEAWASPFWEGGRHGDQTAAGPRPSNREQHRFVSADMRRTRDRVCEHAVAGLALSPLSFARARASVGLTHSRMVEAPVRTHGDARSLRLLAGRRH